ncbi:MAG: hypothetical protein HPY80_00330 [Bacteroidales bacterium]|nr:hypothetical protein [Bacteroidales bacterium]
MIEQLYIALADHILSLADADNNKLIKHVDLWNRQIEFIQIEDPFPLPAVFIEFKPIKWHQAADNLDTPLSVLLHIACKSKHPTYFDNPYLNTATYRFQLLNTLRSHLSNFVVNNTNWNAGNPQLVNIIIDHDHTDISDDILDYIIPFSACLNATQWIYKSLKPHLNLHLQNKPAIKRKNMIFAYNNVFAFNYDLLYRNDNGGSVWANKHLGKRLTTENIDSAKILADNFNKTILLIYRPGNRKTPDCFIVEDREFYAIYNIAPISRYTLSNAIKRTCRQANNILITINFCDFTLDVIAHGLYYSFNKFNARLKVRKILFYYNEKLIDMPMEIARNEYDIILNFLINNFQ